MFSSPFFIKKNSGHGFLFASLVIEPLNMVCLTGKDLLYTKRFTFFPAKVNTHLEGNKNKNGDLHSLKVYPSALNLA